MRVGFVMPDFGPAAGGVGSVVKSLARKIADNGPEVAVFDLAKGEKYATSTERVSSGGPLLGLPAMVRNLRGRALDIIHLHGVWHPVSLSVLAAHLFAKGAVISTPHGMLERWILSRGKAKKFIAKLLYERWLWSRVACFHALTPFEVEDIRRVVPRAKIFYIPNGVDLKPAPSGDEPARDGKIFLYLGRFHSKKGIRPMIDAWAKSLSPDENHQLWLVGWGDEEETRGWEGVRNLKVMPPVFDDEEKSRLLKSADFLILPSFSEGLPMVVLEAWAHSLPVIMTAECNLPVGFERDAAIKVTPDVEGVAAGFRTAIAMSGGETRAMGLRGRQVCEELYSLDTVAEKVGRMYQWAGGAAVPVDDILMTGKSSSL